MGSVAGGGSSSKQNAMSASGSQNSNSSGAQSSMGQDVWGGQSSFLQGLYGAAQNLFGQNNQQVQNAIPGAVDYMNNVANGTQSANQGMQQGGVYNGLNIGNQLMDSLNQSQNSPSNMQQINSMIMGGNGNNYLDAMKGTLENDASRINNLNSAENSAQAAASGMSGGSRQGVLDSLNRDNTNRNLQNTEAQLGYNTFDTDLQRKLGIAQQADSNTLARQNLMSGMLGQQQGAVNQGIQNSQGVQQMGMSPFQAYQQPWTGLQNYSNTIGGPTVLNSGQSSSNSQGQGSGWGFGNSSGSSKGGQAGANFGNIFGAND
jgi:hypothetical protein